ncbi:MAG: hypothetical protein C4522_13275 [Desulfobacteraceae bacterium]|nr:MAG: hypothetical protein C4522_13275 [Desulfobacteraceae bacterium]
MKPLFTKKELSALATPFPDRIIRHIRRDEIKKALSVCHEMRESRILLHDYFADSCTVLWSWVGERLGEDAMEKLFRDVFKQSAERQYYEVADAQVMPHLTVHLLAKSWRAHSCFGAGEHPATFRITEDHDKFTFHLEPCASGARLWKRGWYENGKGGRVSESEHAWTYNRKGFPYYCIHCPFLNEILPYESGYGMIMWPVDPLKNPDDTCAWHVYKNPCNVPDGYYQRLGIRRKPKTMPVAKTGKALFFDPYELKEMARPMTDRISENLLKGDPKNAARLCREVRDEFLTLHDLYAMMILATYTFIAREIGEEALGEALEIQFERCLKPAFLETLKTMTLKQRIIFLAENGFGTDNCNRTGYHPGRFSIQESDEEIRFVLAPCGSGGRLIRAGAYEPMPPIRRFREKTESAVVNFAARHIPLPEAILKMAFPFIVTHFTQRKSYSQGKTGKSFPWSFNEKDVPYYCCQCGKISEKLGDKGLVIIPPKGEKGVCIWKLSKG